MYFWKRKPRRKFITFQETDFSYISGNGNSRKPLVLEETTFRALKMFLISQEMELSSPKLEKLFIFQ